MSVLGIKRPLEGTSVSASSIANENHQNKSNDLSERSKRCYWKNKPVVERACYLCHAKITSQWRGGEKGSTESRCSKCYHKLRSQIKRHCGDCQETKASSNWYKIDDIRYRCNRCYLKSRQQNNMKTCDICLVTSGVPGQRRLWHKEDVEGVTSYKCHSCYQSSEGAQGLFFLKTSSCKDVL